MWGSEEIKERIKKNGPMIYFPFHQGFDFIYGLMGDRDDQVLPYVYTKSGEELKGNPILVECLVPNSSDDRLRITNFRRALEKIREEFSDRRGLKLEIGCCFNNLGPIARDNFDQSFLSVGISDGGSELGLDFQYDDGMYCKVVPYENRNRAMRIGREGLSPGPIRRIGF